VRVILAKVPEVSQNRVIVRLEGTSGLARKCRESDAGQPNPAS
jgi:hypothetical protein